MFICATETVVARRRKAAQAILICSTAGECLVRIDFPMHHRLRRF